MVTPAMSAEWSQMDVDKDGGCAYPPRPPGGHDGPRGGAAVRGGRVRGRSYSRNGNMHSNVWTVGGPTAL
jgi:hypothetical protein